MTRVCHRDSPERLAWACDLEKTSPKPSFRLGESQEWPRQTKPKKGQFMNFAQGPQKGVITKGVFSPEKSLESLKFSKFSRISRKWSDSSLFSTVWGFSKISIISKFSRISRKWTFLKRPLFQKTPFSEPDFSQGHSGTKIQSESCLFS